MLRVSIPDAVPFKRPVNEVKEPLKALDEIAPYASLPVIGPVNCPVKDVGLKNVTISPLYVKSFVVFHVL
jgi:hypothetical protein